ncbi:MAG: Gfo/Idh/MocA family oxidoreductase [Candidatus Hydrogenedentes bacterium]|nr:Gfo/Idh/MocA family oxidoreductase [Candidatus Hydrogenedentota bacterium]
MSAFGAASIAFAAPPTPGERITVALITHSGGAHVEIYLQSLAKAEEVGIVLLSDPDGTYEVKARATLGEKLAKVYASYHDLLANERPRLALISMEAKLAPAAIDAALDAGGHVMAEKPACTNAEDFAKLAAKANAKGLHLMLALCNRVNPEVVEAKRLVSSGEIGKVYGIEMHIVQDQTRLTSEAYHKSWMADKARAGGGHLTWLGLHWLDLGMFITGAKVEQVAGFTGNVGGQPINIEDSVAMSMRFDNGTFGTLTSGYYLDKGNQMHLKVWGSDGWLQIDNDKDHTVEWYSAKSGAGPQERSFNNPADFDPYAVFVRSAVRASMGLESPPITTDESLRVLQAVYALYRAAESGQAQRIE